MKLSEHFTLEELTFSEVALRLHLNNIPTPAIIENLKRVATILEEVRSIWGLPIRVNSGYRSAIVNVAIGSKANSQHVKGCAADFIIPGLTVREVADGIFDSDIEYDQLIKEWNSWVHISVPNTPTGKPRRQALTIDIAGTRNFS